MNHLYYGDCLDIMGAKIEPESVDLIYLDPPFNSNRGYSAIYRDETGRPLPEQVQAFADTWTLNEERERAVARLEDAMHEAGLSEGSCRFWAEMSSALRRWQPQLLAYLSYMTERLLVMRSLLKPNGSIYLHCDPTASHYLKMVMDLLFGDGEDNFRREIICNLRTSSGYKAAAQNWVRGHDTILYYSKGDSRVFNKQYTPYSEEYKRRFKKKDEDGRRYRDDRSGGRRQYLDEAPGIALTDVWSDIMSFQQNSKSDEYLGYQTQKPLKLLKRIIDASSNPGDLIMDPFCGCAVAMEAAQALKRRWIGMDISIHAIKRVTSMRLRDRLGLVEGTDYVVEGVPRTLEEAKALWEKSPYYFQKWAVEQVEGFATMKQTADGGVDGKIFFNRDREKIGSLIVEVKGGASVNASVIRELRGTLEREGPDMAGLVTMEKISERKRQNFAQEMAQAGEIEIGNTSYPRMQLLSVPEILAGEMFKTPPAIGKNKKNPVLPGLV